MRTLVVFDLDGTLVDAFADIAAAVNGALASRGLPTHAQAAVTGMVGDGIAVLCRRAAPMLGGAELESFTEEVRARYAADPVARSAVFPGALQVLEELRAAGAPAAVLSNKPHALTLEVCARLGIAERVARVQGEAPPEFPRKPDPAGARRLMAELGCGRALVVGDMAPDAELAAALGAPFIAVRWPGMPERAFPGTPPVAICPGARELSLRLSGALQTPGPAGHREAHP
ncbi:MAG: HAD hydrolase-like protein [Candidatus Sumerlaeia bacterium]|nr:HAD hydrolase-like protein [Candidatus Sumerlaeia bacterium]